MHRLHEKGYIVYKPSKSQYIGSRVSITTFGNKCITTNGTSGGNSSGNTDGTLHKTIKTKETIKTNIDAPASAPDFISNNFPKNENPQNGIAREKNIATTKKFIPPTEEEMVKYFGDNGYSEESAKKAWKYYEAGNWMDARGNAVRSWKQKALSIWFKPENEIKAQPKPRIDSKKILEENRARMEAKRRAEQKARGIKEEDFKIPHFLDDDF